VRFPSNLSRRLNKTYAAAAKAAAEKALAGEPIADELARLKEYEALIQLSRASKRNSLIAAGIVGTFCLLLAGLAWAVRIPSTNLHVTIVTNALTIGLTEPWQWSGHWQLGDSVFRLDEMSEINLPPELSSVQELKGRAWLDIAKGSVALSDLELGSRGIFTFLRNSSAAINILSFNAPLKGQLQIFGSPAVSAGEAPSRSTALQTPHLEVPLTILFYGDGHPRIPARIRLNAKDKITWRNIAISKLSFFREESGADEGSVCVSGIESGTVTIGETGEKAELQARDQLYLESFTGIVQELELGPDALRLSFKGRAKKVSVGVTGFEENLAPTWLSYLYHQERLGFLWGAVAFLWGIIWSGRELLLK
jgi:hypothetical protein